MTVLARLRTRLVRERREEFTQEAIQLLLVAGTETVEQLAFPLCLDVDIVVKGFSTLRSHLDELAASVSRVGETHDESCCLELV